MKLELNLVSTRSTFDIQFKLLERKRIYVESNNPVEALKWCFKFLAENTSLIEASTSNTQLVQFINSPKDATISDLFCIKYLLTLSGLDLLFFALDEGTEENPNEIKTDEIEYTLVDNNYLLNSFIPTASKLVMNKVDANVTSVLKKLKEDGDLFNNKYLSSDSILQPTLQVLEETLATSSKEPGPIVNGIDVILTYLGKSYIIIESND